MSSWVAQPLLKGCATQTISGSDDVGKGSSKYDPLRTYLLSHRRRPEILMALEEIETILGFKLCESARCHWWWANTSNDAGHSQRRIWGDAGFDAFLAPTRDTVNFVRTDAPSYPALERRSGGRRAKTAS